MKKGPGIFLLLFLMAIGCKDPYNIKVRDAQQSLLVVEGFLNAAAGPTSISLSRTFGLNDASVKNPETGASVTIEGQHSGVYLLPESNAGTYVANLVSLDASQQYRLHIKTATGKEYASDYVSVQATPPIDSVNWVRDNSGVTIYANTHDPSGNSKYYRWEYTETWETHAFYVAREIYDESALPYHVRDRTPNEMVYQCWKTSPSTSLNLASSNGLKSDVIFERPVVQIPANDEKLNVRYSILVKQYVLSKEAYDFFQLMKKNTESLGTVFDPQPSQVTGNIHAVANSSEQVIGFFYASSVQELRIFISNQQLPGWNFNYACNDVIVKPNKDSVDAAVGAGLYPYQVDKSGFTIIDYHASDQHCFDCTVTGGKTTRPDFW